MPVWISLFGLAAFVAYLTRDGWRMKRSSPAMPDPKLLACLVEQQAKLDLQMTALRALLKTHPDSGDIAILLRAAATHLSASSARQLPDTHVTYERALRATLEQLVGDR
ncbi:hypothetical protein C9I56_39065 [Paraburkholderia caribensis]|uniref:hypothetical protein n=1 Tax=Paraburkholderia caribensis TaxID=75105 RepID=UPI000D15164C|nr:hypothetical protein [Paraburkholderia caribensis]PTB23491.1 hypothetical protein C9I56_39065 [Paraburkholderia caribensis]